MKIKTHIGEIVTISLESNPSTGHRWIAKFEPKFLKLVKQEFISSSNLVGAGGTERFDFKAVTSGTTTLHMVYKREWESTIQDEKKYTIVVT